MISLTEYPVVMEVALVSLMKREFVTSAKNVILERWYKKTFMIKEIGYIDNLNDNDYVIILLNPLIILTGGR